MNSGAGAEAVTHQIHWSTETSGFMQNKWSNVSGAGAEAGTHQGLVATRDRPLQCGDQQIPGGDRPMTGCDRPMPGGDRPMPGGDRPMPGGDRPPRRSLGYSDSKFQVQDQQCL